MAALGMEGVSASLRWDNMVAATSVLMILPLLLVNLVEPHPRGRHCLRNYSAAYLNSGSILRPSFVPPGSTNFLSTNFRLS
jgi:hypothetical protein